MRKTLLGIFLLLFLSAPSFAQPVIHFEEMRHDFGAVGQGETVRHFFEFTNAGDRELVIEKVSAS
jgi:Protein of unknown function (DUF1573)